MFGNDDYFGSRCRWINFRTEIKNTRHRSKLFELLMASLKGFYLFFTYYYYFFLNAVCAVSELFYYSNKNTYTIIDAKFNYLIYDYLWLLTTVEFYFFSFFETFPLYSSLIKFKPLIYIWIGVNYFFLWLKILNGERKTCSLLEVQLLHILDRGTTPRPILYTRPYCVSMTEHM